MKRVIAVLVVVAAAIGVSGCSQPQSPDERGAEASVGPVTFLPARLLGRWVTGDVTTEFPADSITFSPNGRALVFAGCSFYAGRYDDLFAAGTSLSDLVLSDSRCAANEDHVSKLFTAVSEPFTVTGNATLLSIESASATVELTPATLQVSDLLGEWVFVEGRDDAAPIDSTLPGADFSLTVSEAEVNRAPDECGYSPNFIPDDTHTIYNARLPLMSPVVYPTTVTFDSTNAQVCSAAPGGSYSRALSLATEAEFDGDDLVLSGKTVELRFAVAKSEGDK